MLAIIPARGGSKGLPGKNIRNLNGKPLIAHTVEAALGSKEVGRVVLSTDSEEIAAISKRYGAEVPFMRPAYLAQDDSLAIDNYIYTVDRLATESGNKIEEMVVLLPTAPLRNSDDIDSAIKLFREKNADSVISFYPAPHPVQWHHFIDDKGVLRPFIHQDNKLSNRQKVKEAYLPNGAIYVFKYRILKEQRAYYTDRTYPYIMPAKRSVDIDTIDDFNLAEFLMNK